MNLLFTSAGRRVELLHAFRRAHGALGLKGKIIAVDISPLAPALKEADQVYIVPRLDAPDYIPTLVRICQEEKVDAIFPLIDPDIPNLARHRATIEATGARLAVVPLEASEIAADKWLTTQFFAQLGLPTPKAWLPDRIADLKPEFPLFIKPRFGSAAKDTFQLRNADELAFFSHYVRRPIIQEFLPGPEITCDVICDLDGCVLSIVQRQRIEVRSGEVLKGVTIYDAGITDACLQIARALPAIGPITVQCILKEGEPRFTEINARLGGGLPLGIAAGVDSPRLLLMRLANMEAPMPPLGGYKTGLYISRFDESCFLTEDELERLASNRL